MMKALGMDGDWCKDAVGVDAQTVDASVAGTEVHRCSLQRIVDMEKM
jgi:hypothetical protein